MILLLTLALAFFSVSCHSTGNPSPGSSTQKKTGNIITLRSLLKPQFARQVDSLPSPDWRKETLILGDSACELQYSYPIFTDWEGINHKIQTLHQYQIERFIENCESDSFFNTSYLGFFTAEMGRNDSAIISVCMDASHDYPGGKFATVYQTFNYDPQKKTWFTLPDLFTIPKDSVWQVIEKLIISNTQDYSIKNDPEHFLFNNGSNLPDSVFDAFILTNESLIFYLGGAQSYRLTGPAEKIEIGLDEEFEL